MSSAERGRGTGTARLGHAGHMQPWEHHMIPICMYMRLALGAREVSILMGTAVVEFQCGRNIVLDGESCHAMSHIGDGHTR